ncbi:hypothetical protein VOLCADRAFT_91314 [Volvox carteri f. nagariensis]|uniref:Uncharacterized protein n=1 Tax=Volvox carteri f. nagariensis TaxID=3068 RepID=D8TWR0_VOLCA|nr:uncharacterized protein VOLCADRAFT_91314 [Volvox carteri f. nagariensis]EFJ48192.1 hypothetical protein VOLCADRAFT_91314 [Volvox carteri f. nagariensis]|eukprot:XP_002950877.1 hypothetical protein VOLCADRAFT_91314 [Volvox carteri f. nagariensis]
MGNVAGGGDGSGRPTLRMGIRSPYPAGVSTSPTASGCPADDGADGVEWVVSYSPRGEEPRQVATATVDVSHLALDCSDPRVTSGPPRELSVFVQVEVGAQSALADGMADSDRKRCT